MKMNRRNVLVGLGTVVAGGGAALGTGAFSSVEAERTVDVKIADGDSNALLALAAQNSDYVTDEGDGDTLKIELPDINPDATTTIDNAFSITNHSGEDVNQNMKIWAEADNEDAHQVGKGGIVQFNVGDTKNVEDGGDILVEESGDGNPENLELAENGHSVNVEIVIDTSGQDLSNENLLDNVTFYADGEN